MSSDLLLRSTSPEQTRALAAVVATELRPGDVVALSGDLGAGKTCFVQGAARGLGVTGRVTSPTFTLVRTHLDGRVPVVHADVYRLDRLQDVLDLGDDVLAPDAVTFVEWGDAVTPLLPDDRLEVELSLAGGSDPAVDAVEGDRLVRLTAVGARWPSRLDALADGCAPWREEG
ncbi:tRNA (adenosine(37)-N6)-threonylcarbamoyltransferase complex ATPase subunit type 1 TsaE [Egicoccus halophilus]|uniref:tRNA threonylcarbamoyladenosine biosynthesis protein TsaE n=1 Tax=Egicoccus halophilus TaxID=1670830 RepID=A0A8J3A7Q5_9ACTN|nr:tRNA (adenosine(37)-N6)-threonylcarbamoyltransferase complex ATPase subunit type 1 TsaE [Egicoccus halophilus]GGI05905.1 tRNA threonylcarbamoyladenosine biosynthesis protein TsaE [Egicoccus halophilus]